MNSSKVQMIGLPFDGKSSFLRGSAQAPSVIREELFSDAYNLYDERMLPVLKMDFFSDRGDLELREFEEALPNITTVLNDESKPLFIGGDHSLSYATVRACHEKYGPFHILHFDAHSDLYPEYLGDQYSHACPFARILEGGYCQSLTQVGIRAMTPAQQEYVDRYGVKVFQMNRISDFDIKSLEGPLYISLDLDGIDPAFAPGVSHREAGGLTSRQVINWLQGIEVPVIGADLVELNPLNDVGGITAALCGKLVKELIGVMVRG